MNRLQLIRGLDRLPWTDEQYELARQTGGIVVEIQQDAEGVLFALPKEKIFTESAIGRGYVKDYTVAQMKAWQITDDNHPDGAPPICSLEELLAFLAPENLKLLIIFRNQLIGYVGMEEKAVALVHRYGLQDRVYYAAESYVSVTDVLAADAQARAVLMYDQPLLDPVSFAVKNHLYGLMPLSGQITETIRQRCRQNHLVLFFEQSDHHRIITAEIPAETE
ncbi:MAG: hypothetical protein IKF35_01780 [Solobacterium sp.]|nr:hypothetical protein [Solobacterium sp.]